MTPDLKIPLETLGKPALLCLWLCSACFNLFGRERSIHTAERIMRQRMATTPQRPHCAGQRAMRVTLRHYCASKAWPVPGTERGSRRQAAPLASSQSPRPAALVLIIAPPEPLWLGGLATQSFHHWALEVAPPGPPCLSAWDRWPTMHRGSVSLSHGDGITREPMPEDQ